MERDKKSDRGSLSIEGILRACVDAYDCLNSVCNKIQHFVWIHNMLYPCFHLP